MQAIQRLTLDVNSTDSYKYVYGIQFDNKSRILIIKLEESGKPFTPPPKCTAMFRCLKPDGTSVLNSAIINSDGTIIAELTNQVLAVKGEVEADISLIEGETVLSSATFKIEVEKVPASANQAISTNEFLILNQKIAEVNNAIDSITNATEIADEALNRAKMLESYIGYTENDILGVCVDYENKRFTRLAGAAGKDAGADFDMFNMYGGRRRCTVTADGTITAFQGDENYTVEDKTVQIMVYQPKFYYRVVPLKLEKIENGIGYYIRKANYYVSDTPKAGFKLHPAFYDENGKEIEYILFSAFEGSYVVHNLPANQNSPYVNDAIHNSTVTNLEEDCIMSLYGTKPISGLYKNLTRANAETLCRNFGRGWHCETIKTLSANQLLMMIEFGTMNMQQAVENGITAISGDSTKSRSCYTGSTNSLGNNTGHAESSSFRFDADNPVVNYSEPGKRAVSYRGIENPWGNLWKWIQGINVYGTSINDRQMYVASDFNFKESTHTGNYEAAGCRLPEENSYISAMGYSDEKFDWLFIPAECKGASNLPVGDSWNSTLNLSQITIARTYLYGGAWGTKEEAGAYRISNLSTSTDKSSAYGCRTVYIPTVE